MNSQPVLSSSAFGSVIRPVWVRGGWICKRLNISQHMTRFLRGRVFGDGCVDGAALFGLTDC